MPNESFDLDIMMPPDVADIEQDISNNYYINNLENIGALTPNPMQDNLPGWGY